jgi:hypothetical protein
MVTPADRADALLAGLRTELEAKLSARDLEPKSLTLEEGSDVVFGTKKLFTVTDERGVRYVVKAADPPLAQAEETASSIFQLAGRAVIPARRIETEIPGVGVVQGVIKPFLEFDASELLPADTTLWTEDQRLVLLAEHPWEWFVDNLDANQSQYALLTQDRLPVMIDWDRAFHRAGEEGLSRFHQHRANLPNLRNFLYADYVEARIDLDLSVLLSEARRVVTLPEAEVRRLLMQYAEVRFTDANDRRRLLRRFLHRKKNAVREFDRFAAQLVRERRLMTAVSLPVEDRIPLWWRRIFRPLAMALNAVVQGPIGKVGRLFLRWFRGRRTIRPTGA